MLIFTTNFIGSLDIRASREIFPTEARSPEITLPPFCRGFIVKSTHNDLILNVKFLNRRLFPYIQEGLKPGGVVIFHPLLGSDSIKSTSEHCRDYLLQANELLHAFLSMQIIYYREAGDPKMKNSDEMATLVAVRQ